MHSRSIESFALSVLSKLCVQEGCFHGKSARAGAPFEMGVKRAETARGTAIAQS